MFRFQNKKIVFLCILIILFVLNLFSWLAVYKLSKPQLLEVIFFNVGQGDSIFIESPQGHQILIDGGPDEKVLEKLAKEMPFYDGTLDLIVLTHPDKDHLGGLLAVLERYDVENILWTGIIKDTAQWQEWQSLIKNEGAEIIIAEAGQKIILEESGFKIFFNILYPFENLEDREVENSNNSSIVIRLSAGENSFLFTGDIEEKIEKELVDSGIFLDSDVLKVAHHGSKTSSSEEFLEKVLPGMAIIPVGRNNYNNPHPEVLARLEKFAIRILRTDKDNNIKMVSNGSHLKLIK